jgi:hypothetical protein
MLYLNAYEVSQAYGGREEGGWYYEVGEPLASIPIPTKHEKGQSYYMSGSLPVIQACHYCLGFGKIGTVDEDEGIPLLVPCKDCGKIPESPTVVAAIFQYLENLLEEDIPCRRELRIALENHMAEPFPNQRPTYE